VDHVEMTPVKVSKGSAVSGPATGNELNFLGVGRRCILCCRHHTYPFKRPGIGPPSKKDIAKCQDSVPVEISGAYSVWQSSRPERADGMGPSLDPKRQEEPLPDRKLIAQPKPHAGQRDR
jgi:hypothetical protein